MAIALRRTRFGETFNQRIYLILWPPHIKRVPWCGWEFRPIEKRSSWRLGILSGRLENSEPGLIGLFGLLKRLAQKLHVSRD